MNKLIQVLEEVFKGKLPNLNDFDGPETIAEWDSFNHMIMVTALEKKFNVKITTDDVMAMTSIGNIKNILKAHGVPDFSE